MNKVDMKKQIIDELNKTIYESYKGVKDDPRFTDLLKDHPNALSELKVQTRNCMRLHKMVLNHNFNNGPCFVGLDEIFDFIPTNNPLKAIGSIDEWPEFPQMNEIFKDAYEARLRCIARFERLT